MVMMTKEDYEAIGEKLHNPDNDVRCPRCGNELIYEVRGNSIAITCKTENCIHGGLRGL